MPTVQPKIQVAAEAAKTAPTPCTFNEYEGMTSLIKQVFQPKKEDPVSISDWKPLTSGSTNLKADVMYRGKDIGDIIEAQQDGRTVYMVQTHDAREPGGPPATAPTERFANGWMVFDPGINLTDGIARVYNHSNVKNINNTPDFFKTRDAGQDTDLTKFGPEIMPCVVDLSPSELNRQQELQGKSTLTPEETSELQELNRKQQQLQNKAKGQSEKADLQANTLRGNIGLYRGELGVFIKNDGSTHIFNPNRPRTNLGTTETTVESEDKTWEANLKKAFPDPVQFEIEVHSALLNNDIPSDNRRAWEANFIQQYPDPAARASKRAEITKQLEASQKKQ